MACNPHNQLTKVPDDNEEEEEDDGDDDNKDNDIIDDNPRCSLPNCTHHDLIDLYDVASKQTDQSTLCKTQCWGSSNVTAKSTFGMSW